MAASILSLWKRHLRPASRLLVWAGLAVALLPAQAYAGDLNYALEPTHLPWAADAVAWDETEQLLQNVFEPQWTGERGVIQTVADVPLEDLIHGDGYYAAKVQDQQDPERREDAPPAAAGEQPAQPPQRPLGQAPQDNSLLFLRTATVLLQPGQFQFDYGGRYTWRDIGIPALITVRNRQIYSPFALRYGWTERVQLFANMPVGFAIGEDPEPDRFSSIFGVGDSTFGANFLVRDGYCDECDVVGTVSITAPLGHHPFEHISNPTRTHPTPISGAGFWGVSANLTFIKSYDPAVVFGSVGYSHLFERSFGTDALNNAFVIPGEQFNYSLGMGFAINDRLTLSTAFFGTFQTVTTIERTRTPPPVGLPPVTRIHVNAEPFQVRLALTALTQPSIIIEPFVIFGLNEDAPEADFGITWTKTF